MSYCQRCGSKIEDGKFCKKCGNSTKTKKNNKLVYSVLSFLFGGVCFIPSVYLSANYYKVGTAIVMSEFGDDSELLRFRTFERVSDVSFVLGILFIVSAVILLSFFVYEKLKNKNNIR